MLVKNWQTPKVIFQPELNQGIQKGINQLANAIRPTLGPFPRLVAIESSLRRDKFPELLDCGGLIARRMVQLTGRDEDTGAMLLRHMLWELYEKVGDGTATAAVIFQSIYNQSLKFIAAGGDAMLLRTLLEQGAKLIVDQLEDMKVFIHGKGQLTCLARTLCFDSELANILGEIFDSLGEYGYLDIRAGTRPELEWQSYRGFYWEGGLLSRSMIANPQQGSTRIKDAAILLSDLEIEEPGELISLLELVKDGGFRSLMILARKISERALYLLNSQPVREKLQILVVKTPGMTIDEQWAALQDLSILTGGRPLLQAAGDTLNSLKKECLGTASQIYVDLDQFGILEGSCPAEQLQKHIDCLKSHYAKNENSKVRQQIRERIGKLQGGTAVLWIGAATPLAIDARTSLAKRTSEAMRSAMRYGVVPGGCTAYLDCCSTLKEKLSQAGSIEERAAYQILIRALQEPFRTLLSNAGISAGEIIGQIEEAGQGYGFDLSQKQVVEMIKAGIYDSAVVAKAVIICAVRAAALALTMQVLVHRRNPPDAASTT